MPFSFISKTLASIKKIEKIEPLSSAIDHFIYEPPFETRSRPYIRDIVDLKRWMILVVLALFPCILVAIWNTGVQKYVFTSGSYELMQEYISASESFRGYFTFTFEKSRWWDILKMGLGAFLPVVLISYIVGGFWEILFACIRKHDIAEGFLVSGILYALILPPTLPYWMIALGVTLGIILSKEVFGGTGMNILNPALVCRCFLYFAFPAYMTGEVWVGTNSHRVKESILQMNQQANLSTVDAISQQSWFGLFNIPRSIKRIHIDTIASHLGESVDSVNIIEKHKALSGPLNKLSQSEVESFLTAPIQNGGLGLSTENLSSAFQFAKIKYGHGLFSDGNLFFGNKIGSFGEVSILAVLLGALLLLITRIGSWRTMLSFVLGMIVTAGLFRFGSHFIGPLDGLWNPAIFDMPIYKHFLVGSAAFGLVFMATDPVSSPGMNTARYAYGFMIGMLVIIVRILNPAYPEGVMLAILFGNVFAPLFDHLALYYYRKQKRVKSP